MKKKARMINYPEWLIAFLAFLLMIPNFLIPVTAAETETGAPEEQKIWDYLMELTDNPLAAAGIMGNLYYESGLDPQALEDPDSLPISREDYTDLSQEGMYPDFAADGHGYGLAQWTYPSRKLRLLELAEAQEASIGDVYVQLQLLGEELEKYHMLYRISHADSIRFAADYFLTNYENPGVQDEQILALRVKKGQYYYDKFTRPVPAEDGLTQAQRDVAQIALHGSAYGIPAEQGYCMAWVTAVYREAGLPTVPSPSALSSAGAFSVSDDLTEIPVGAAVYGRSSHQYGHVGLYLGSGLVCHNAGGVKSDTLEDWIQKYQGFCWGWPGGIDLTALP